MLKKHPTINAAYVDGGIKYNKDINVAMAVAIDGGLITPTIIKAQDQDLFQMSRVWKELVEKAKVMGRADTVQADRQKMREALASMKETKGLLGKVGRTDDREAIKPFLFVQAKAGNWIVAHTPKQ